MMWEREYAVTAQKILSVSPDGHVHLSDPIEIGRVWASSMPHAEDLAEELWPGWDIYSAWFASERLLCRAS